MTAAALPEVAATVWSNVMMVAGLRLGRTFLVHGGAGGIGTFAIQLASRRRRAGAHDRRARAEKLDFCRELGADVTINYRDEDFVEVVREVTDGRGADVILDNMGAAYLGRNVAALATEGRLVVIGMQGGTKAELDLGALMRKRAAVVGDHAAGAAGRGEDRDLPRRRRARLAAGGRRDDPPDRRHAPCRWPRPPRPTA